MRDPYEVLEVDRSATVEEIKRVYRKKAKACHPDLHPGDETAAERFKELSEAYSILSDEDKRQKYDTYGAAAFENGGMGAGGYGFDMGDIFGDFFGDLFGGGRRRDPNAPRAGADIQVELRLTFREAVFGCKKEVTVTREVNCSACGGTGAKRGTDHKVCPTCHGRGTINQTTRSPFGQMVREVTCPRCHGKGKIIETPCEHCHGTGREQKKQTISVSIPAGVDDGNILPMRGQGHGGFNGGANGDLYVVLRVAKHELFQRNGSDLFFEMPISFTQAALGDKLEVPTLTGTKEFELPEGTDTGALFTLKGEGVENVRTKRKGDLHFRVIIQTPKNLNEEQKEALRKYAELTGKSVRETKKSFFDKVKDFFE